MPCGMMRPVVICQEKDAFGTWVLEYFGVHLGGMVWKVGTEVVVLGGGRRGSFGEAGQTCQEGLSQKVSVACFGEVGCQ